MNHSGLSSATIWGSIWSYTAFSLGKFAVFLTTVILARILQPEDFGLMAMALVVINFLKRIQNLGVGDAFIYHQDQSGIFANTAFLISIFAGGLFSILVFFSAPVVAAFFHEPKAVPVIQVLSVWFIIINLGAIHESTLRKAMNFRKRFFPQLAQSLSKGGCAIALAFLGFGVWSLVIGQLAGEITATVMLWIILTWRPKLQFNLGAAQALIGYGTRTILMKFLQGIFKNIDYLFIGRRMDATQLGLYTIAFRLPDIVIQGIQSALTPVIFSAYVKVQDDMAVLKRGFLKTLNFVSVFSMPISLGMYIIAPEFVEVFYTNRWEPVVPVMRALSVYAIINTFDSQASIIYRATDKITLANKIEFFKMISAVPVLWIAAGYSILIVSIVQIILALITAVIQVYMISRILGIGYTDILKSLKPCITAAAVMIAGIWLLNFWIIPFPAIARMVIVIAWGSTLYAGALKLISPDIFQQLVDILKKRKQAS